MSFSCNIHSWAHALDPCPTCLKAQSAAPYQLLPYPQGTSRPTGAELDELIKKTIKAFHESLPAEMRYAGPSPESCMAEEIEDLKRENGRLKEGIWLALEVLDKGGGGAESIAASYLEEALKAP